MKIRFISFVFILLFLQSCVLQSLKKTEDNFLYKKILTDTSKSYIYRANLSLYNNDFSGMIIIKPTDEAYRIVFINEIGMKFFDFEFSANNYKVNHIFEPINKKMFIKLLINDFRFILMSKLNLNYSTYKNKQSYLYVIKPKNEKELYYFNLQNKYPEKAIKYSIFSKTTVLKLINYNNDVPNNISIKHKNVKFAMDLSFVK